MSRPSNSAEDDRVAAAVLAWAVASDDDEPLTDPAAIAVWWENVSEATQYN